jgi:DNA modification methylase
MAAGKPPLKIQATTLWEYPSQHYGPGVHGDKNYPGATPSWVIWNLLERYTRPGDLVVDPMVGSGTTLDVARELDRRAAGFDVNPQREDITNADARKLPLADASADFVFVDPPYSTHIEYSDDPRCIGKLDALEPGYWRAMEQVIAEIDRVLKDRRYMALYVSDSFRKGKPFLPIGFDLFAILRKHFRPVDIIAVVRHNAKLARSNWQKEAVAGNFFLRGFNYLFIMKKQADAHATVADRTASSSGPKPRPPHRKPLSR